MNDILQLRGTFNQRPSGNRPGPPKLPKNAKSVSSNHLKRLVKELEELGVYWQREKLISGALIDVHYIDVSTKSNRIGGYFNKSKKSNDSVVGARFDNTNPKEPKHIITYYVTNSVINDTIAKVNNSIKLLDAEFSGTVSYSEIENIKSKNIKFEDYSLSESVFFKYCG